MALSEEARVWVSQCAELDALCDDDGIVCLPAVRGKAAAVDRLRVLLARAFGAEWSAAREAALLRDSGCDGLPLALWLRDKFFAQHVARFQKRPFIWHVWDGHKEGFSALLNGHTLTRAKLQTLTQTYLGDWITQQRRAVDAGDGDATLRLARAEALKTKLEAEGLFDLTRKPALPGFPRQIGIITSPHAAALRDVLATLKRRMPAIPVVLYPTPVQGKGASLQIAHAIKTASMRKECDVLILCRGGGSIEDLWEFNEEVVARALVASPIPIICGVGHETDFTIADFAASQRAPTPTAAAELTSPNRVDLAQRLAAIANRLAHHAARTVETRMQHLDHLAKRLVHPGARIRHQGTQLEHLRQRLQRAAQYGQEMRGWKTQQLCDRLNNARPALAPLEQRRAHSATRLALVMGNRLASAKQEFSRLSASLSHLNPQSTLERGYSIARDEQGRLVRDSGTIKLGDGVELTFAVGTAQTKVTAVSN